MFLLFQLGFTLNSPGVLVIPGLAFGFSAGAYRPGTLKLDPRNVSTYQQHSNLQTVEARRPTCTCSKEATLYNFVLHTVIVFSFHLISIKTCH